MFVGDMRGMVGAAGVCVGGSCPSGAQDQRPMLKTAWAALAFAELRNARHLVNRCAAPAYCGLAVSLTINLE